MYYRKYRPQKISEVDNARIRDTLGRALLNNDFAHAYLLTGTRGSGKTSLARLIAKIANCQKRRKGEEPCNKCASCLSIRAGTSLDVIEIDAASNTGVEDIRELRERVKLAPTASLYKVYIIDEVHMLSTSAFNALLKTLEEPPEKVIFVLATTDAQKLPATIVSRCLVYDFGDIATEDILASLKRVAKGEGLKVDDGVLSKIAEMGAGSFRDAQKILQQMAMHGGAVTLATLSKLQGAGVEKSVEKILATLSVRDAKGALATVEEFIAQDGKIRLLMVGIIEKLRVLLLSQIESKEVKDKLIFSAEEIQGLIKGLIDALTLVRESPVPQLPLEMVIMEFCGPAEEQDEDGPKRLVSPVGDVAARWPEILSAIKPYNHSLVALLRASRPKELSGEFLTLEVFYKFHKEKLSEVKNREILEKVLSGIIGKEIKVKFLLAEKR